MEASKRALCCTECDLISEPLPGSAVGFLLYIETFKVNTVLWDAGVVIVVNSLVQGSRVLAPSTSCRLAPAS